MIRKKGVPARIVVLTLVLVAVGMARISWAGNPNTAGGTTVRIEYKIGAGSYKLAPSELYLAKGKQNVTFKATAHDEDCHPVAPDWYITD